LRWKTEILFRDGTEDIQTFEELAELQGIVERGPDWNEIDKIIITLNLRSDEPLPTVEELDKVIRDKVAATPNPFRDHDDAA
jgi:hypothetical protein